MPVRSPSASGDGLAQHECDVLDGVVLIDVEVAGRRDREVDQGVMGKRREEVVVEADPRRDGLASPGRRGPRSTVTSVSAVVRCRVADARRLMGAASKRISTARRCASRPSARASTPTVPRSPASPSRLTRCAWHPRAERLHAERPVGPREPPVGRMWFGSGGVVARRLGRERPEEDRAGVLDARSTAASSADHDREVLRRVGVDEGEGAGQVGRLHEQAGRMRATCRRYVLAGQGRQLTVDLPGRPPRPAGIGRDEHRGRVGAVLRLRQEVGGDVAGSGGARRPGS